MPARTYPKLADRKTLIARAKTVHRRCGRRWVTVDEFCRLAGISRYRVTRCFDSYGDLLRAAGLPPRGPNGRIPDDELMRAMAETFRQEKGPIPYLRFRRLARYSAAAYLNRWGSWRATLQAFACWQKQNDPDFPHADLLPGRKDDRKPAWPALGGRRYGETLNFRGLLHAPVNEQGVVFLFATLATDLGYLIDSLGSEFPDCEAKRRVGKAWERVRIEFEFESRNFSVHAHDPEGCDLIVCWEHNWPECPLEVLELKTVVAARLDLPTAGSTTLSHSKRAAERPILQSVEPS